MHRFYKHDRKFKQGLQSTLQTLFSCHFIY